MKENCNQEYGTRYPTLCFYSGGAGQAQDGIPPQPFETFCYDSALKQAKSFKRLRRNTVLRLACTAAVKT